MVSDNVTTLSVTELMIQPMILFLDLAAGVRWLAVWLAGRAEAYTVATLTSAVRS